MDINVLAAGVMAHVKATKGLRERVDYLNVAVMRGDPRFARTEFAKADFDCAAFDEQWAAKGKRVPSMAEVFGA
jgi:hypothetical protein